ncbi:unnamed protein product [Dracunculus medinensis]|uniref:Seipin n=1 Tax=Dracunculus medinensis TaxID=318479 RepID=A0A0N4UM25_DRAME|nr:unnamed protein product [Dracunculus medinensis]
MYHRILLLPTMISFKSPLNFIFLTCPDELSGVCSFPTATIHLAEENWYFNPTLKYEVNVAIELTNANVNDHLGMFQLIYETIDEEGKKIVSYHRSVFLKKSGYVFVKQVAFFLFYPLYYFQILSDPYARTLRVSFTDRFKEIQSRTTSAIVVQLQNKFLEIESGVIMVEAKLGFMSSFLFYWPFISGIVIFIFISSIGVSFLLIFWFWRGFSMIFHKYTSMNYADIKNDTNALLASSTFQTKEDEKYSESYSLAQSSIKCSSTQYDSMIKFYLRHRRRRSTKSEN